MTALFKHMTNYVTLDVSHEADILSYFTRLELDKKEIFQRPGEHCFGNYFVVSGCVQMYFDTEKGVEQTVQFALENWWITDQFAFLNGTLSEFYLQAVEPTELMVLSQPRQTELFDKYPMVERYFRIMFQIAYGAAQRRKLYMSNFSKEEIYFRFRDEYPAFVQRVPQYLLASFLGLTPEYLSEIKNREFS